MITIIMNKKHIGSFLFLPLMFAWFFCSSQTSVTTTLTRQQLKDKIKGGWAGQTIGVTFGGPYEFRFNGTFGVI